MIGNRKFVALTNFQAFTLKSVLILSVLLSCIYYTVYTRPLIQGRDEVDDIVSTCSDEATSLGPGQRVISFCLFEDPKNNVSRKMDTKGLEMNLKKIKEVYPGWVVRLYTDSKASTVFDNMLNKNYSNFYLCDITNIPKMGNLKKIVKRTWRFLPLGDPLVDIFISRDLDSVVSLRERAAVSEWEKSDIPFHSMRDHIQHSGAIQAGMWGAKNKALGLETAMLLQSQIIKTSMKKGNNDHDKFFDQKLLKNLIYFPMGHRILAHDSYFCRHPRFSSGFVRPFPTKREGGLFVGQVVSSQTRAHPCPEECRPVYGKNWTYC